MEKLREASLHISESLMEKSIKKISRLSFIIESFSFGSPITLLILFLLQSLGGTLIPALLLTEILPESFSIRSFASTNLIGSISVLLQGGLLGLFIGILSLLSISTNQATLRITGKLLIACYYSSPLLLMLSANFVQDQKLLNIFKILGFLNLVLILLLCCLCLILTSSLSAVNHNKLTYRFSLYFFLRQMAIRIGCIFFYVTWHEENKSAKMNSLVSLVFVLLNLTRLPLNLIAQVKSPIYFDCSASYIYNYFICFELSLSFTSLLTMITDEKLILQNCWPLSLSLFIFLSLALKRYLAFRNQQLDFLQALELKNSHQARLYLQHAQETLFEEKFSVRQERSISFKKLQKSHQLNCSKARCACKNQIQETQYYNVIIKELLDQIQNQFSEDNTLIVMLSHYKLDILELFINPQMHLNSEKKEKNKSIFFQVEIHKYYLKLKKFLNKKAHQLKMANIQRVSEADQLAVEICVRRRNLISLKQYFWGYLYRESCHREKFLQNIDGQLKLHKQFHSMTKNILVDYPNSEKLVIQLLIYEMLVLLKPRFRKQFIERVQNLRFMNSRAIFQKNSGKSSEVEKYMFRDQCCTFRTIISSGQVSKIVRASSNVQKIFGYKPSQIEGLSINQIIPHTMRKQHEQLLIDWMDTGRWNNLGVLKQVFALKKNQVCFPLSLYLKVFQTTQGISLIASCFQVNNGEFMLFNNKGAVEIASSYFLRVLGKVIGLPISVFCDYNFPVQRSSKCRFKVKSSEFYEVKSYQKEIQTYLIAKSKTNNENLIKQAEKKLYSKIRAEIEPFKIQFQLLTFEMGTLKYTLVKFLRMQYRPQGKLDLALDNFASNKKIMGGSFKSEEISKNLRKIEQKQFSQSCTDRDQLLHRRGLSSEGSVVRATNFTIQNLVQNLQAQFFNKKAIKEVRAFRLSVLGVLLCLFAIICSSVKLSINLKGYSQIQELFFADGACSDNMQMLEFMYNKILNMRLYRERPELQLLLLSADFERTYLQNLVSAEILNMQTYRTSLIKERYFLYQLDEVDWTLENNWKVKVTETQFIAQLLAISKKLFAQQLLEKETITVEEQLFFLNFPQLKQINHQNLELYLNITDRTFAVIRKVSISKLFLSILAMGILISLFYKHYSFRVHQEKYLFEQYGKVSKKNCLSLKKYFEKLQQQIVNMKDDELFYSVNGNLSSQLDKKFTHIHQGLGMQDQTKFIQRFKAIGNKRPYWLIWFGVIFLSIITINIKMYFWDTSILTTCTKMMKNINELMDSQNYILEAYFDLKGWVVLQNTLIEESQKQKELDKLVKELLKSMYQSETAFNIAATESLSIFAAHDPQYLTDMIALLSQNLCLLQKDVLPEFWIEKCLENMELKILQQGLMNSMNLFQRSVLNAIYEIQKNIISRDTLLGSKFKEIDSSIFYNFKMYQGTQQRITYSLKNMLQNHFSQIFALESLQIFLNTALGIYSILFYFRQRQKSRQIKGYCSIIPMCVMRISKGMANKLSAIANLKFRG